VCHGLFSTCRVARRSRARKSAENKIQTPKSRVCTTNPGAQWTCAPYLALRLSASAVKRSRARKGAENQDSNLETVPA